MSPRAIDAVRRGRLALRCPDHSPRDAIGAVRGHDLIWNAESFVPSKRSLLVHAPSRASLVRARHRDRRARRSRALGLLPEPRGGRARRGGRCERGTQRNDLTQRRPNPGCFPVATAGRDRGSRCGLGPLATQRNDLTRGASRSPPRVATADLGVGSARRIDCRSPRASCDRPFPPSRWRRKRSQGLARRETDAPMRARGSHRLAVHVVVPISREGRRRSRRASGAWRPCLAARPRVAPRRASGPGSRRTSGGTRRRARWRRPTRQRRRRSRSGD